jgi:hypothetical protein
LRLFQITQRRSSTAVDWRSPGGRSPEQHPSVYSFTL